MYIVMILYTIYDVFYMNHYLSEKFYGNKITRLSYVNNKDYLSEYYSFVVVSYLIANNILS